MQAALLRMRRPRHVPLLAVAGLFCVPVLIHRPVPARPRLRDYMPLFTDY